MNSLLVAEPFRGPQSLSRGAAKRKVVAAAIAHLDHPSRQRALLSTWSFALAQVPQPIFSALVGLGACIEAAREKNLAGTLPWNLKAPNDLIFRPQKNRRHFD